MRFRFALLQITWEKDDPTDDPPAYDTRSTTALTTERAEPRRIGFTGDDDLPDHEGKRR